jgi:hypothetical protein
MKKRHELFLEGSVESFLFSFKTNKRIYKSIVFLSFLNKKRKRGINKKQIESLHKDSILRMLDILRNGSEAAAVKKSPL